MSRALKTDAQRRRWAAIDIYAYARRRMNGELAKDELEELLRQAVINTGGKPAEAKEK